MARTLEKGRWAGVFSRTKQRINQNLGIIDAGSMNAVKKFRDDRLELYDSYYEKRQYDDLMDWDAAADNKDEYIPVRKRKPRINFNAAKVLVDRVAAKLVGEDVWPSFMIEDDPDTTEFLRVVQKVSEMKHRLMEPVKQSLAAGSSLVRFKLVDGTYLIESYQSKFCYPTFQATGELESVQIKYIYVDYQDKDPMGNPKKKWFRLDLGMQSDILYDSPEYKEGQPEPEFQIVEQADHNLGFVQGEWLRTKEDPKSPDGPSLYKDVLDFFDELNYSFSQSSQAVGYNQDPQTILNGMNEDEIDELVRSSSKAWNLGKDGKAEMLEGGMSGVEAAAELRTDVKNRMIEVIRIVMLDPEKIVGSAQSGKAMEVLHGPLVELINELRPLYASKLKNLLIKMAMATLILNSEGMETAIEMPAGFAPKSLDITVSWPAIFPATLEDIAKKVAAAAQAVTAFIISPETATRWVAKDFGVEDVEAELAKIEKNRSEMAALNPFGTFGG